jgi:carbon-monoxide dehydrogenase medium subunit
MPGLSQSAAFWEPNFSPRRLIPLLKFELLFPTGTDEVVDCLDRYGQEAAVIAGGTDLLLRMKSGKARYSYLISLSEVRDLDAMKKSGGCLVIGPRATMSDVRNSPDVKTFFPALGEAAQIMGSQQIRNKATVIGNVCNASPAAETATPLLIYEATVSLLGKSGAREMPLENFFKGPGDTAKEPGELVTAIKIPLPASRERSVYRRISRREGVDLAIVNIAIAKERSGDVRLAYGSLAPVPFRPREVEAAIGSYLDGKISDGELSQIIESSLSPIDDLRSSRLYKAEMAKMLTIKEIDSFAREVV